MINTGTYIAVAIPDRPQCTCSGLFFNSLMLTLAERIFVGRSHVAKVAEARLEQINIYCQVRACMVWDHEA